MRSDDDGALLGRCCVQKSLVTITPEEVLGSNVLVRVFDTVLCKPHQCWFLSRLTVAIADLVGEDVPSVPNVHSGSLLDSVDIIVKVNTYPEIPGIYGGKDYGRDDDTVIC